MTENNANTVSELDQARLKLSIEHYIKYFIGKRACELTKGCIQGCCLGRA